MNDKDGGNELKRVMNRGGAYPPEAFQFVKDGMAHTVKMVYGEGNADHDDAADRRHISGQQLCLGLKDFASKRYGLLAKAVLSKWHVEGTSDFGKIVFAMIEAELIRKSEGDSIQDFDNVFDFDEAFGGLEARRA